MLHSLPKRSFSEGSAGWLPPAAQWLGEESFLPCRFRQSAVWTWPAWVGPPTTGSRFGEKGGWKKGGRQRHYIRGLLVITGADKNMTIHLRIAASFPLSICRLQTLWASIWGFLRAVCGDTVCVFFPPKSISEQRFGSETILTPLPFRLLLKTLLCMSGQGASEPYGLNLPWVLKLVQHNYILCTF